MQLTPVFIKCCLATRTWPHLDHWTIACTFNSLLCQTAFHKFCSFFLRFLKRFALSEMIWLKLLVTAVLGLAVASEILPRGCPAQALLEHSTEGLSFCQKYLAPKLKKSKRTYAP